MNEQQSKGGKTYDQIYNKRVYMKKLEWNDLDKKTNMKKVD